MQLAAFNDNNFALGHAAMLVNEGLPLYVVSQLAEQHDLVAMTVGILGMSFKAGSDDIRSSLAYKLKRILSFKARQVLMTDPYVTVDPDLVPLEQVLAEADLLIVATPHPEYRSIRHRQAGRRRLERPGQSVDVSGSGLRVSVRHPGLQRGRRTSCPVLDRLLEAVTLPCEVLVVVDSPDDTTSRSSRSTRAEATRRCASSSTTTDAGRRNAIRYGIDHAHGAGRRRHDGRRLRRPAPDRRADPPGRARRRRRRRVALHAGRPAGRRPVFQALLSRTPAAPCTGSPASARATPPTRSRPTTASSSSRSASTAATASRSASS